MKLLRVSATLKTLRRHMLRNGVSPPNVYSYNVVIRGFAAAGNIESVSEPSTMIAAKMGVEPNLVSMNAVIQGLCVERRKEEAEAVFEEMKRKGLAPDEKTYSSLIHLFCDWGIYTPYWSEKADKVLSEMIDSGFSPSVVEYNKLIHSYCSWGWEEGVEKAVEILRSMPERGLSPDAESYSNVISKFGQIWELEKAFEMKKEMVDKGFLPDADTYSRLINRLCWIPQAQPRLSEAFDLFREMLRRGVLPEEYTYYTLMYAYCEKGEFSKAFHMHEEMIHKGFLPDFFTRFSPSLVTCNALIHGLSFFGRAEEALEILRGMPEMGLFPDTVSYTAVVSGFCRIGELRKAYDLKMEMDEMLSSDTSDVRPLSGDVLRSLITKEGGLLDEVNYTSVINAYCADGEVVKAEKLLDELTHYDVRRCVIYDVFVNGLDKKARTKEAKEMLLGWVFYMWWSTWPTLTFDTLIENCSNNEFKSLVELVKGLRTRDLENEAASVMNTVFQWNYKPDGAVYNFLIVEHCRCKNVDKAYNMYTEMVHYGIAPHMFSVLALIHVLYCDDRYNEMSWVIQNTLRSSNLNDSELHKLLNEIGISKGKFKEDALFNVLAEIAMDGLLLNGGKCSYAPTRA